MAKSITGRMLAVLAAALLACTMGLIALAPQSAHAAQLSDTPLTTQAAAKKSVYVRASIGDTKYTYNKYGLLTKITDTNSQWKFKYSGTKLVKVAHLLKGYDGTFRNDINWSVSYDSKNRVKKLTVVSEGMPNDLYNNTETYYYNSKNQATKRITAYKISGTKKTTKYSYNAKGLVNRIIMPEAKDTLKYDSRGNKIKWTRDYPAGSAFEDSTTNYTNTYKNGRLVKIATRRGNERFTYTQEIKYKKISIPKKYAAIVASQQKEMLQTVPGSMISLVTP